MMSNAAAAKPPTADFAQVGYVAHVNFRVRCEGLGHGEEVFLVEVNGTTTSTSASKVRMFLFRRHVVCVSPSCGRSVLVHVGRRETIFFGVITLGCFLMQELRPKASKR
jgi:hypothetical protein